MVIKGISQSTTRATVASLEPQCSEKPCSGRPWLLGLQNFSKLVRNIRKRGQDSFINPFTYKYKLPFVAEMAFATFKQYKGESPLMSSRSSQFSWGKKVKSMYIISPTRAVSAMRSVTRDFCEQCSRIIQRQGCGFHSPVPVSSGSCVSQLLCSSGGALWLVCGKWNVGRSDAHSKHFGLDIKSFAFFLPFLRGPWRPDVEDGSIIK